MNDIMTKVDIITSQNRLDDLLDALNKIGITGLTVSNVLGCGIQKGHKEVYRGTSVDIKLLPKIKVEIVICEVPVDLVVETAKQVLHTGKVGDGKIFIYNVTNVIRVSDGSEGRAALQYKDK
jgi:nitrogen regulatory protein P-II 1